MTPELPSLKLTFLPLKTDGWKTILSYWGGLFSGAVLVSGRVSMKITRKNTAETTWRIIPFSTWFVTMVSFRPLRIGLWDPFQMDYLNGLQMGVET